MTFGPTPLEILTATEAQLNEYMGLKKLAPYRPERLKESDRRKYGKKKRLREWRKKVTEEGNDEQIRAMFRPEKAPETINGEEVEPKKKLKRRKSRKSGKACEEDQVSSQLTRCQRHALVNELNLIAQNILSFRFQGIFMSGY